jgi:secondary thiamine-phosphate synthase enzyme
MQSQEITLTTGRRPTVADITQEVAHFVGGRGDGLVNVFVPHATAGVALIETGAGSDRDLLTALDGMLPPEEGRWVHTHGAAGHGRDHVMPAFISPSISIPVVGGRMTLGTWQSVVVVDPNVDNPERRVRLSFLPG